MARRLLAHRVMVPSRLLILAVVAFALGFVGCAQTVYYGANPEGSTSTASLDRWASRPALFNGDVLGVLEVDGKEVPVSKVSGTFGPTLSLDETQHSVKVSAAPREVRPALSPSEIGTIASITSH